MSALLLPALAAGSSGQGALYVDDVFSTYLYTGNGSTQTINNGIDLAGKGGLVWFKSRSHATNPALYDTARGATKVLTSSTTNQETTDANSVTSFGSTGFSVAQSGATNANTYTYVSWTFRRAPRFFDVVTYTGTGTTQNIAHSLGVQAGFVTVKATSTTGDWNSYHRSATGDLKLNTTDAQTASRAIITAADASTFAVSGAANTNGVSYVAYLWAHKPSAEGIVQCGSFTTDASGNATVNLGWEPQFLLYKGSSVSQTWHMVDTMRGWVTGAAANTSDDAVLFPNLSNAETTQAHGYPTATGFVANASASTTYIYLAIRRPNKPPTSGAQVYSSSTASGVVSAGFPVDLHIGANRTGAASNHAMHTRLTGGAKELVTSGAAVEATITDLGFDSMTGLKASLPSGMVNHFFRRATGFFDVVCYTGDGSIPQNVSHGLSAEPELVIIKNRSASSGQGWPVFYKGSLNNWLRLDTNQNMAGAGYFASPPTSTQLSLGYNYTGVSAIGNNYVAYLFASLAGISKVGSYTGNGSSQTIDCGFSTGARFFLVKATSTAGSWWVYDSARGIVSAADPSLQINSTAAEITSADAVDPASVGIIVNQEATCSINATGVNYIFLAIA